MSAVIQQLRAMLARLNAREQRLVLTFGALLVLALAYLVVVEPLVFGRRRLQASVDKLRDDIGTMQRLSNRILVLESLSPKPRAEASDDGDFSLFSFMDRVTTAAVEPDSIESMNPSRRKMKDGTEEVYVEIKLARVTLGAVVALLRGIEEAGRPIYVRQFEMRRKYDDKTRFDLVLVAATLVPA